MIRDLIKNKTAKEKANIKGQEIAKIASVARTNVKFSGADYDIEVIEMNSIEGGVSLFARAWRSDGSQVGFGKDGTVDLERFRVINPPILVDNSNGTIIRTSTDSITGEVHRIKLREDLKLATLHDLAHTIKVTDTKPRGKVISGKRGSTHTIYRPDTGNPGTTTVDAGVYSGQGAVWDTQHDLATGASVENSTPASLLARLTGGNYDLQRFWYHYDTDDIDTGDTIDSAILSIMPSSNGQNGVTAVLVSSTAASDDAIITADYDAYGTTEFASRVTSFSSGTFFDFSLNASGISNIDKDGVSKFAVIEGSKDFDDVAPSNTVSVSIRSADEAGTDNDPKLVVVHSVPDLSVSVNDAVSLTEDIEMLLTSFISVNDSITVAEDVEIEMANLIDVNDSITLSESVTVENPTLPINVNDSITVAESVTMLITFLLIDINDTISVAENVIMEQFNFIDVNDSISIAESTTLFIPFFVVIVNDSISVAENVTMLRTSFIDVNDSITVADVLTVDGPEINIDISDSVSLTEFIDLSKTIIWAGRTTITASFTDRTSIFDEIWTKGHRDEDAKYTKE